MTSGSLGLSKTELLLRVSGLSVDYVAASGDVIHALRHVDFEIGERESVGVLGESGSGKSSLALALLRLLPPNATVIAGSVDYRKQKLLEFSPRKLREMRGADVSLISQEPALALNPVLPLGRQITDVLKAHRVLDRKQLSAKTKAMLQEVGFEDPVRIMRAYPHQLSGGQRQRVAIAQALVCRPSLLIADEPLSSLDAATQAEILELLERLKRELNLAMMFITHNAGVLSSLADRVIVMRAGQVRAISSMDELKKSSDPYIQGVLFPEKIVATAAIPGDDKKFSKEVQPLLQVRNLSKRFVQQRILSRKKFVVNALQGIELTLAQGTTVALIGRSGSGKSTLARCIAGFETPDSGEVLLEGSKEPLHRQVQMIFQDAATSLNPRFTATQLIAEPLEISHSGTEVERRNRALQLMEEVGLDPAWQDRLAGEFSGGQRQRLALARALAAGPKLLIMDEALSGLDMPLQAQMVRLLLDLQARHGLTYLYISHDLNFVSLFAQEIVVMHEGKIVERLTPPRLGQSSHPATRALVEASERLHAPGMESAR